MKNNNYFQTNHYEVEIDKIDPITLIDELYDEPIIDSSLIPNILIFKNIPREIKVTIGGDGADELFEVITIIIEFTNYIKQLIS